MDHVNTRITANGINPNYTREDEIDTAKTQAREEYLSVLFIKNCDPTRYSKNVGALKIRHVENDGDPYSSTLAKALEMLETSEEVHNENPPPAV